MDLLNWATATTAIFDLAAAADLHEEAEAGLGALQ